MKRVIQAFFLLSLVVSMTACGNAASNEEVKKYNFSEKTTKNLMTMAKCYTEEELQNGEVPLNEYIQLSGEIIVSDGKEDVIQKGDRFILKSGDSQYQVFNEQEQLLQVGDKVTVYGEYYGFLKGTVIERNE